MNVLTENDDHSGGLQRENNLEHAEYLTEKYVFMAAE